MNRENEEKIYGKMYDMVEQRMSTQGLHLPCTRDTFLYSAKVSQGCCDGALMEEADNPSFLQMAYMGVLNRLPDQDALDLWKREYRSSQDVFRCRCMDALIFCSEALGKQTVFINNTVVETKQRDIRPLDDYIAMQNGGKARKEKLSERIVSALYRGYSRLPYSLRRVLRKIFKRASV